MSKAFSSVFGGGSGTPSTSSAPTGFQSLPGFAQEAFREAVERGQTLSEQPGLFAPPGLTQEQEAALGTLESGLAPTSAAQFQAGLETFGDPFEEQVVQSAIRDIQEAGQGQFSDIGQLASAAGGFGGTRQALLESELFKNIQRNVGDVSGQLRSSGFQAAADRTLGDLARTQQVAQSLFPLAETERGILQAQQQAPLSAVSFLSNLARGVPTGGGGTSVGASAPGIGILPRIGSNLGTIGKITTGLGSLF